MLMNIPNLHELKVCRNLLSDAVMQKMLTVLATPGDDRLSFELTGLLIEKAELLGLSGNLLQSYTAYLLSEGGHAAAAMSERYHGEIGDSLRRAFHDDMRILHRFLRIVPSDFLPTDLLDSYRPTRVHSADAFKFLQEKISGSGDSTRLADVLLEYYRVYGCGDIANFRAFHWDEEHGLVGIRHYDPMTLDDLIGYQRQKEALIDNTEAFVSGKPANNVLLVGARGTGKSSGVKALANHYFDRGLRLLEITKRQLNHLPKIMGTLRQIGGKKFIIFLDDLSFEDGEVEYKLLKSAIEGGVEAKPDNALIYATSNRRHLIKETWKDRGEISDELHRNDSVNETISLSDRFGLTIHYLAPAQSEYLEIIAGLLEKEGVALEGEDLRIQALRWEMTHSGRSGRTARQFVTHYLSGRSPHS